MEIEKSIINTPLNIIRTTNQNYIMKKISIFLLALLGISFSNCGQESLNQIQITPEELMSWQTFDKGRRTINGDELIVEEIEGSNGYFIISPEVLKDEFVLKYKVKALSSSTVLINLFSVTQEGNSETFELPPETSSPSEVWQWRTTMKHYNLTFNNKSHGTKPFFFKNKSPYALGFRERLPENIMETDKWYSVEIGKKAGRVWFKLNDVFHFDIADCQPLKGGRLIFRISGTTGENVILAKAAYKDIMLSYE